MKRTATIDYHGVPLVCEFNYYPGFAGTLESPPEPETCEVESVLAGNVEIIGVFDEEQLFELGDACLEWVTEDHEIQMHEHADMQREERRLGCFSI
jgi:hypothetical protein